MGWDLDEQGRPRCHVLRNVEIEVQGRAVALRFEYTARDASGAERVAAVQLVTDLDGAAGMVETLGLRLHAALTARSRPIH